MLLDLAQVVRKSGLIVVELDGWRNNSSPGGEDYKGVLCHHTGGYDEIGDTSSDLAYARWLAFTGRPDLPPPLCNLGLSAESVVYVTASGNANHAGRARASGPMPAANDGSRIYVGIEAYNSGSQGWSSKGKDADGNTITQYEGYARLCAALCEGYKWPASHVRAHRETSVTGKWDPGLLNMTKFRGDVALAMRREADMGLDKAEKEWLENQFEAIREQLKKIDKRGAGSYKRDKRLQEILKAQGLQTDQILAIVETLDDDPGEEEA